MESKNILIVGVGGQGTLLTSRIVGKVALDAGFDVKLSEVHGMAQRGGSVVTHVRYGEKVNAPLVEIGEADVILSFEKLETSRYAHYLKQGGTIIANVQEIDPMPVVIGAAKYPSGIVEGLQETKEVVAVNALEEAKKLGNIKVVNTFVLGVLAQYLHFEKNEWILAIEQTVPKKSIDLNIKAFETGYNFRKGE
jgi:indolepyruvate ferredoxin oxidoreductase beta subunit